MRKPITLATLIGAAALLLLAAIAGAQTCLQVDLKHPQSLALQWVDNANNETGFILERKVNSGDYAPLVVGGVGANITSYTDSNVSRGAFANTYTYRLKAILDPGDGSAVLESAYSNEACATFLAIPPAPAAPSGLTLSAISASQIQASWRDNSDTESRFRIETVSFAPPAKRTDYAAADTTSLVLSGLKKNSTYCSTAYSEVTGGVSSLGSNESCATTLKK